MTTPAITNVSGTITTGQTLTITGTTMMDEDNTNWTAMFRSGTAYGFEGTGPTLDGWDMGGGNAYDPVYDTAVKLHGSKSLKGHGQGAWSGPAGPASMIYTTSGQGETGDIWIRFYVRFHLNGGSWPDNYQKIIDSQGTSSQLYLDLIDVGASLSAIFDSTGHAFDFPGGGSVVDGKWYCIELHWKTSAPLTYVCYVDGTLAYSGTPSGGTLYHILIPMINYADTTSSFNEDVHMDLLTMSSSRIYPSSIVEIGNNATYALATKVYQAPTTLSNTSILITADLTGLGAGPYYLWVTNNKQERSDPYDLSGGTLGHGSKYIMKPKVNILQQRRKNPKF